MNGVLQTTCTFTLGTFVVTLDQAISLAAVYVFEFNVINQDTYPAQQGYYWANTLASQATSDSVTVLTASKTLVSDIIFFGTNQARYVSTIAATTTVKSLHSMTGETNLLIVSITLSSGTIGKLIFEFESASLGSQVYTSNTMHGFGTGTTFPCSGGTSTAIPPTCLFEQGEYDATNNLSRPLRVHVTAFTYTTNVAFTIYLVV